MPNFGENPAFSGTLNFGEGIDNGLLGGALGIKRKFFSALLNEKLSGRSVLVGVHDQMMRLCDPSNHGCGNHSPIHTLRIIY